MDLSTSETPTHESGWDEKQQASFGDLTQGTSTTHAMRSLSSRQSGRSDQTPGASSARESVEEAIKSKKKKSKKKDKKDPDPSMDRSSMLKKAPTPAPLEQSPGETPRSPGWEDHDFSQGIFNNMALEQFEQKERYDATLNSNVPIDNRGGDYNEEEAEELWDTRSRGSAWSKESRISASDEQIRRMMMAGARRADPNQASRHPRAAPPIARSYDESYYGEPISPHHLSPRLPSRASSTADAHHGRVEPTFSPHPASRRISHAGSQNSGSQNSGPQYSVSQYNGSYAQGGPHYNRSPQFESQYDGSHHAGSGHPNPGQPWSNHSHAEHSLYSRDTPFTGSTPPVRNYHETSQAMPDFVVGGRLADGMDVMVGEEGFEDDSSVNSDLTGLTGAFSTAFITKEANPLTDDEQKPSPEQLAYPKYDGTASKFAMMEAMKRADEATGIVRPKRKRPPLRFGTVQVRTFERILGDNPSTTSGAPIGIGWKFTQYRPQPLHEYETRRGPTRPSQHLVLNRDAREFMLVSLGYSKKDIAAAVRANLKCRNNRRQTVQNLKAEMVEEKMENAVKGVMRLFGGRKDK